MKQVYKKLEFDKICQIVAGCASADIVAEKIIETEPTTDIVEAQKMLTQVEDAIRVLALRRPSLAFDDILPNIDRARVGALLSPAEFLQIKNCIAALRSLKSCVESTDGVDSLKDITAWVRVCDDLEYKIDCTVASETEIKDGASSKLASLRKAILRTNAKLKERLDGLTHQSEMSKYLQDNIVTVRDGRFVVPVKSEYRSHVKGLIHDVSSTGSTVFIEPFAIVEINNELKTLQTEEQIEIERILSELGKSVVANAHELTETLRVLIECGIIFAKAEYAKKIDAYRPKLNTDGKISLPAARHPLISSDKVVPVDIVLDKKILLISGPNTGGKTVALKTVGLFALMAASGMFLPAHDGCEMCVFGDVFCDIGDAQSITQSLSTFSAHMTNIVHITTSLSDNSLVLLDEVGDGTDPDEGAALAIAIIKKILRAGATAIITTHFNSVKEYALECNEISNACMQFDNVNFEPTYKLIFGASGSSYAIEIAEKLGLDGQIIYDARAALNTEKVQFDSVMRETERLRNEAIKDRENAYKTAVESEEKLAEAQRLKDEYEKKRDEIKSEARNMIRRRADEYSERAEQLIDEIKALLKNADEAALFSARAKAKKIYDNVPGDNTKPTRSTARLNADELHDGMRVFVSGFNKEGIIVGKPKGNKVTVAIGSIKTDIPASSLSLIEEVKKSAPKVMHKSSLNPVNTEIMLIGLTVDEAVDKLDKLLDDIPHASTVRAVHGKGTGALGKGIQAYLKRNNKVKSFRYGGYGEGDSGVTIIELK